MDLAAAWHWLQYCCHELHQIRLRRSLWKKFMLRTMHLILDSVEGGNRSIISQILLVTIFEYRWYESHFPSVKKHPLLKQQVKQNGQWQSQWLCKVLVQYHRNSLSTVWTSVTENTISSHSIPFTEPFIALVDQTEVKKLAKINHRSFLCRYWPHHHISCCLTTI